MLEPDWPSRRSADPKKFGSIKSDISKSLDGKRRFSGLELKLICAAFNLDGLLAKMLVEIGAGAPDERDFELANRFVQAVKNLEISLELEENENANALEFPLAPLYKHRVIRVPPSGQQIGYRVVLQTNDIELYDQAGSPTVPIAKVGFEKLFPNIELVDDDMGLSLDFSDEYQTDFHKDEFTWVAEWKAEMKDGLIGDELQIRIGNLRGDSPWDRRRPLNENIPLTGSSEKSYTFMLRPGATENYYGAVKISVKAMRPFAVQMNRNYWQRNDNPYTDEEIERRVEIMVEALIAQNTYGLDLSLQDSAKVEDVLIAPTRRGYRKRFRVGETTHYVASNRKAEDDHQNGATESDDK